MKKITDPEARQLLVTALREAKQAALDADPGAGADGGTCNMDTPAFAIKGARAETIRSIAEEAGVRVDDFKRFGATEWWVRVPLNGQGDQRSTMMGAAQKVLDALSDSKQIEGFSAMGWYQMD